LCLQQWWRSPEYGEADQDAQATGLVLRRGGIEVGIHWGTLPLCVEFGAFGERFFEDGRKVVLHLLAGEAGERRLYRVRPG